VGGPGIGTFPNITSLVCRNKCKVCKERNGKTVSKIREAFCNCLYANAWEVVSEKENHSVR